MHCIPEVKADVAQSWHAVGWTGLYLCFWQVFNCMRANLSACTDAGWATVYFRHFSGHQKVLGSREQSLRRKLRNASTPFEGDDRSLLTEYFHVHDEALSAAGWPLPASLSSRVTDGVADEASTIERPFAGRLRAENVQALASKASHDGTAASDRSFDVRQYDEHASQMIDDADAPGVSGQ